MQLQPMAIHGKSGRRKPFPPRFRVPRRNLPRRASFHKKGTLGTAAWEAIVQKGHIEAAALFIEGRHTSVGMPPLSALLSPPSEAFSCPFGTIRLVSSNPMNASGAKPNAASGRCGEANAQGARALKVAAFATTHNDLPELRCGLRIPRRATDCEGRHALAGMPPPSFAYSPQSRLLPGRSVHFAPVCSGARRPLGSHVTVPKGGLP